MTSAQTAWTDVKTVELTGLRVALSQPVLVARSKGHLWFPTLVPVGGNELLGILSDMPDVHTDRPTGLITWSRDGGLTWSEPRRGPYADCAPLRLPNGDLLLLSNYLYSRADGDYIGCDRITRGARSAEALADGVAITNWPRPLRGGPHGLAGFGFTGQTVALSDGGCLATLYGHFEGAQRYSLVAAQSADGRHWSIRSVIADDKCALEGSEGPCEAALCRLEDGRLMCVFRNSSNVPYGQCWSEDEGGTWTTPVASAEAHSVQPSLAVMHDGIVAMSGGRPGIFLWFSPDGTGKDWQAIDVRAHHNECCPGDPIGPGDPISGAPMTTSYTEIVRLDDEHLLLIYDRIPHGWSAILQGSPETNSVWVVRVGVRREGDGESRSRPGR